MLKKICVLILASMAMAAVPMTAAALSLDVEAKGGAGFALGSTDNKDVSGVARLAAQGGVSADLYLFNAGPVELGLSTGAEYAYLTTHSTWKNYSVPNPFPPPTAFTSDQTTDTRYNFLIFPISVVARYPLSPSVQLVGRLGGFIGVFLNGKFDLSWNPVIPGVFTDSTDNTAGSGEVRQMEYGIHATAGADIALLPNVSLSPAVQLDMGLTDTTPNNAANGDFKDTLWSLTVMVGVKYKAL